MSAAASVSSQALLRDALAAHRRGDGATAERLYSELLRREPGDFNALHLLGLIRAQQRNFAEADRLMGTALRIKANPEILNNHAIVLTELGRHDEAIKRLNRALALKADYAEAHYNLGNALKKSGRLHEAEQAFAAALRIRPGYAEALQNRSDCLRELDRQSEAIADLQRAIEISPRDAKLYNNLGIVLRDIGNLEEALPNFARAVALDPRFVSAYYNLVRSGKVESGELIQAMETLSAAPGGRAQDEQARLLFALAKAYDDVGRHAQAFATVLEANRLARALIAYDEEAERKTFERIRQTFSADLMRARAGRGNPSELPVFIVGFPRSGTTLIEQILASHPQVHGAGELELLRELAIAVNSIGAPSPSFPESILESDGAVLRGLGNAYVESLSGLDPSAARITNKNLGNVALLGFARLILPQARIIHVTRDALDTCLSSFFLKFADNAVKFSYELGELGRSYRLYQEMMNHWRAVLAPGSMLEVQYESVVENVEAEARRIVEHCGLAWDERCLSFHNSERAVRTASVSQVRQPIYRSSVQRWRRYERELGPLLSALGRAADESAP